MPLEIGGGNFRVGEVYVDQMNKNRDLELRAAAQRAAMFQQIQDYALKEKQLQLESGNQYAQNQRAAAANAAAFNQSAADRESRERAQALELAQRGDFNASQLLRQREEMAQRAREHEAQNALEREKLTENANYRRTALEDRGQLASDRLAAQRQAAEDRFNSADDAALQRDDATEAADLRRKAKEMRDYFGITGNPAHEAAAEAYEQQANAKQRSTYVPAKEVKPPVPRYPFDTGVVPGDKPFAPTEAYDWSQYDVVPPDKFPPGLLDGSPASGFPPEGPTLLDGSPEAGSPPSVLDAANAEYKDAILSGKYKPRQTAEAPATLESARRDATLVKQKDAEAKRAEMNKVHAREDEKFKWAQSEAERKAGESKEKESAKHAPTNEMIAQLKRTYDRHPDPKAFVEALQAEIDLEIPKTKERQPDGTEKYVISNPIVAEKIAKLQQAEIDAARAHPDTYHPRNAEAVYRENAKLRWHTTNESGHKLNLTKIQDALENGFKSEGALPSSTPTATPRVGQATGTGPSANVTALAQRLMKEKGLSQAEAITRAKMYLGE